MQRLINANTAGMYTVFSNHAVAQQLMEVPPVLTIPDNPTNGDIIKALFPNVKIIDNGFTIEWRENGKFITTFDGNDWWNAPYKAESEE